MTQRLYVMLNYCFIRKQEAFKWTCSSSAGDPRLRFDFISFLRELLRLGRQRKMRRTSAFKLKDLVRQQNALRWEFGGVFLLGWVFFVWFFLTNRKDLR